MTTTVVRLAEGLLLMSAICATPAWSSAYYNNEYLPHVPNSEVGESWGRTVDAQNIIKRPFSCEQIYRYFHHPLTTTPSL